MRPALRRGNLHAILIIAVLLLAVWPFGHDPFILPKMFLTAWILLDWAIGLRVVYRTPLDGISLVVLGFLICNLPFSKDVTNSFLGQEGFPALGILQMVIYAMLFNLGAMADPYIVRQAVLFFAIPMTSYSILQRYGIELPHTWHLIHDRGISTQGSPILVGSMLAIAFPIALGTARKDRRKFGGILSAGLFLWGVWACDCRSAFAGMIAGAFVYFYLKSIDVKNKEQYVDGTITSIICLVAAAAVFLGIRWFHKTGLRPTDAQRLEVYKTSLIALYHNPKQWFFGCGNDNFTMIFKQYRSELLVRMMGQSHMQQEAHNLILQILLTTGITGFVVFGWFLWKLGEAVDILGAAILTGILAQSMFEPIHFPAIALLAVVLGSRLCRSPEEGAALVKKPWLRYPALLCAIAVSLIYVSDLMFAAAYFAGQRHDYPVMIRWAHGAGLANPSSINSMQIELETGDDVRSRVSLYHPTDSRANQIAGLAAIVRKEWDSAITYLSLAHEEDPLHSGIEGMLEQAAYSKTAQGGKHDNSNSRK